MGDLMPVLPEEIARECLIRVPYDRFATVRSVCRLWRQEVESPLFHRLRLSRGLARTLVALAQAEPGTDNRTGKNRPTAAPVYRLALFEPGTGTWRQLPPVPGLPHGLPLFCGLAAVGRKLIVVGGWDPDNWAASDAVHVYDFISAAWRPGASVPGPRRSFFACAGSEADGLVFVAGGHDEEKNALGSALAYDVGGDRWVPLPDMARERDECKGVFLRGGFHVIGGYTTEAQGRFVGSAEAFDVATWSWGPLVEDVLEEGTCPRTCIAGRGGKLYMVGPAGKVMCADMGGGSGGRLTVAEVPEDARVAPQVAAWGRSLMVVGSGCHGGPQAVYMMELAAEGKAVWRRAGVPQEYTGHVQAACCLEI